MMNSDNWWFCDFVKQLSMPIMSQILSIKTDIQLSIRTIELDFHNHNNLKMPAGLVKTFVINFAKNLKGQQLKMDCILSHSLLTSWLFLIGNV